jgi:pantoate--beta-alanine ligase
MNRGIELVVCPTVREPDGLAMSSRNLRLSEEDRKKAPVIYQCLQFINERLSAGGTDWQAIQKEAEQMLQQKGLRTDYVELANADTLELVGNPDKKIPLVALIAAFLGDVRLIDNMKMIPPAAGHT